MKELGGSARLLKSEKGITVFTLTLPVTAKEEAKEGEMASCGLHQYLIDNHKVLFNHQRKLNQKTKEFLL